VPGGEGELRLVGDPASVIVDWLVSTRVDTVGELCASWGEPLLGKCSRCGVVGEVWAHRQLISFRFTGWDRQPAMQVGHTDGWCFGCAVLYAYLPLRTGGWFCTLGGVVTPFKRFDAGLRLLTPLSAGEAVIVPLSGRKHLVGVSLWGCVSTDGGVVSWGLGEAVFANQYYRMRQLGATSVDLLKLAPPVSVVRNNNVGLEVLQAEWDLLKGWRGTVFWNIVATVFQKTVV